MHRIPPGTLLGETKITQQIFSLQCYLMSLSGAGSGMYINQKHTAELIQAIFLLKFASTFLRKELWFKKVFKFGKL